jgi:hypothetical protein
MIDIYLRYRCGMMEYLEGGGGYDFLSKDFFCCLCVLGVVLFYFSSHLYIFWTAADC